MRDINNRYRLTKFLLSDGYPLNAATSFYRRLLIWGLPYFLVNQVFNRPKIKKAALLCTALK